MIDRLVRVTTARAAISTKRSWAAGTAQPDPNPQLGNQYRPGALMHHAELPRPRAKFGSERTPP
jgi:hypothetical protein